MKKMILFAFVGFSVNLSLKAQTNYFETPSMGSKAPKLTNEKPISNKSTAVASDDSYYYWENNSRHTAELNALLGTTGAADNGFDTLGLYTYKVKEKPANGGYWQKAIQGIPTTDTLSILAIDFVGNALNAASSNVVVNVYKKDLTTLLATKTVAVPTTYGYQTVTFDNPVEGTDTMLVVFQMATVADSFQIAKSHSQWTNYNFGPSGVYTSTLPFVGDAAILAVAIGDNESILGLIQDNFDFFVIPTLSYNLKSDFTVSGTDLCLGDSVSFTNTANTAHQLNPVLNYIHWDYLANGAEPAYTTYDFGNGAAADYIIGQDHGVTYASAGTFNGTAGTMIWPWTSQDLVVDAQAFSIVVTDCSASIEENLKNSVSVYPNPTNGVFEVKGNEKLNLTLVSNDGKEIFSSSVNAGTTKTIDLSSFSNGVYFLQVSNSQGFATYKVVKN